MENATQARTQFALYFRQTNLCNDVRFGLSDPGVVCLDRSDGKILWEKTIKVKAFEKGHASFNPASSSPCCDSKNVIAYFGSFGLVCFDHEGNQQWKKELPLTKSFGGNALSPIISGNKFVL